MTKRFSSSSWTGDLPNSVRGTPTYAFGQPDKSFMAEKSALTLASQLPDELLGINRRALALLFSPFLLGFSWWFLKITLDDQLLSDHVGYLWGWSIFVAAIGGWQSSSRSRHSIGFRTAMLNLLGVTTMIGAITYVVVGHRDHARAIVSNPERAFEFWIAHGHRVTSYSTSYLLENGRWIGRALFQGVPPYAHQCVLVQQLDGPYGFRWSRVVDRNRQPTSGQLNWGIRREECFSDIPLAELPR